MSPSSPSITVDVSKDLASASALKTMLTSQQGAVFQIFGELATFTGQNIQAAADAKASASVSPTGTANWTTSNGIGFALTPTAKCSIAVDTVSEAFSIVMNVESTDAKNTQNVSAGPAAGVVYVNIDLDFSIQGSVSGSGTFSGVGVAGKASGCAAATLSFCQPVAATLNTEDAIKLAFSQLVFPLDPGCTTGMTTGAVSKVAFDGSLTSELDVTYGLGDYKYSAPSLGALEQSLQNVVQLTSPSVEVDVGVKGSITYSHTDHFALIVNKTSDTAAELFLVRSSEDDGGVSIGLTAGITTTAATVGVDSGKLQTAVQNVTGSSTIASQIGSAASQGVNALESALNGKLKNWASDATGQAGLSVGLSRQKGNTALFVFQVALTQANLVSESWAALVGGNISDALALKGFTLEPGSGVSDSLKHASTVQFQFFNLFADKVVTDYFSNGYAELGPDGTIRIHRDIGMETDETTKKGQQQFRIYFSATATESAAGAFIPGNVDLCMELSECGNSKYAAPLANVVGFLPASAAVNSAQTAMVQFVAGKPAGSLDVLLTLKQSAYGKISCTPYAGGNPAPLPHKKDNENWNAFQASTLKLQPNLSFVGKLNFGNWIVFNQDATDQVGSELPPDRKASPGAVANVPPDFYTAFGAPPDLVAYFLLASAGFMNFCEDLQTLAQGVADVVTSPEWEGLLAFLTEVITQDVYMSCAQPVAGALLTLLSAGGVQVTSAMTPASDGSGLTCCLTVA